MDQRLRTDRSYNLHLVSLPDCWWGSPGMPILEGVDYKPAGLIDWSAARSTATGKLVHFFVDDYRFEAVWNRPEDHLARLRSHDAVCTPDFSLYSDMPYPVQQWNVYRSRALGYWWQQQGLTVIPTLQWSTPMSYGFAFQGLPQHSTVAVSTIGCRHNDETMELWRAGMSYALETLHPARVIMYGAAIDGIDWGDTDLVRFDNPTIRRFEDGRKRIRI